MNVVSKHVYTENFEKIFEWYQKNVHRADEKLYTYNCRTSVKSGQLG